METLANYRNLVAKIDDLCRKIEEEHADHLVCRKGCDSCCRHISLFWVEALSLATALHQLPAQQVAHIRDRASSAKGEDSCPLLEDGACLLYGARPIICRTHGLPILMRRDGAAIIDFCPKNFRGVTSLSGNGIIDLDQLNTALAAVNALFVSERFKGNKPGKERLTIAEALLLDLKHESFHECSGVGVDGREG